MFRHHMVEVWQAAATREAMQYAAARAAAPPVRALIAGARMTQFHLYSAVGKQLAGAQRHVMACSCAHTQCYKVLVLDSMQKQLRHGGPDPLACPAYAEHSAACKTWSFLVALFYSIVSALWPDACIVWDWVDLEGLAGYHVDATLLWLRAPRVHKRFEIDGGRHFDRRGTSRRHQDSLKDKLMQQTGKSMLRLHVADAHVWQQHIIEYVHSHAHGVLYTPSYSKIGNVH